MAVNYLGINGGDSGDAFMDAPPQKKSSLGGIGGENPLSSLFDAVGIHIGGKKLFDKNGNPIDGTGPAATATQPPTTGPLFTIDGDFKGAVPLDSAGYSNTPNEQADLSGVSPGGSGGVGSFDIGNLFSTLTGILGL